MIPEDGKQSGKLKETVKKPRPPHKPLPPPQETEASDALEPKESTEIVGTSRERKRDECNGLLAVLMGMEEDELNKLLSCTPHH